jgi:exopolyphosphatase/guanosine-5'-triphosphate,3'-diphosphate pyrophosphatase
MDLYASIDIGTNSVLFLAASFESGRLKTRMEKIEEPRIGRGLQETGMISRDSIDSLERCLVDFRQTVFRLGARLVAVAGTQVFRAAENRDDVLKTISEILGHPCRVLSGEMESEISMTALQHCYKEKNITVIDIGGGSTEVAMEGERVSIPIGAVRLLESNGISPEPNRKQASEAVRPLPALKKKSTVIAIGGTATTLAMMQKGESVYSAEKIEGTELLKKEISEWIERLAELDDERRKNITGLPPSRSDVIIPGLCILTAIMRRWRLKKIKVSAWGLRHGLILEHLKMKGKNI